MIKPKNSRLPEYLAEVVQRAVIRVHQLLADSILKNTRFSSELYIPFTLGVDHHMLTVGFEECTYKVLDDDASMTQLLGGRRDKNRKVLYDLKKNATNRHLKCNEEVIVVKLNGLYL